MSKFHRAAVATAAALLASTPALATVSLTDTSAYSQSFDALTTSTTATPWANNASLPGWYLFISTLSDAPTIAADAGGSNAGTFRSHGASGSADRALGSVASGGSYFGSPASGAVAGYIAVGFTNNTGLVLDSFTLAYAGEQWRNGGNTNAQSLALEWGFGSFFGTASYNSSDFGFTSPVTGASAAAVDGNSTGRVDGLGGSIVGLSWAPGETLWLRWTDRNDVGNDHGLAIDDFSFSVTAVPEPGALALMLAGLGAIGFVARRRG
jgi:hypothetical protein